MGAKFESLAANGIIDFDANAYVYGGKNLPAHKQDSYLPFDRPLMASPDVGHLGSNTNMHKQPEKDEFKTNRKSSSATTFGLVLGSVVAAFFGMKLFTKLNDYFNTKAIAKKKAAKKAKKASKAAAAGTSSTSSTTTTKSTKAAKGIKNTEFYKKVSDFYKNISTKVSAWPKPVKIGVGIGGGILLLAGISKLFNRNNNSGTSHH